MVAETIREQDSFLDPNIGRSSLTSSHYKIFLCMLLLIPVLLYLAMFPLVRVASLGYENWGLSKWGPILNFPFQAEHLDADVVVFGDSTAFLGVDPRLVQREAGVTTVVLPNTLGSLPVINDLALEHYLAHNKKPKLLVLYFDPWNLDYQHNNEKHLYFEGEEMLLRNGSWQAIRNYTAHHLLDVLAFPLQLNSTIGLDNLKQAIHHNRSVDVRATLGHRDYTEPWPALLSSCAIPEKLLNQRSYASVQTLAEKYERQNMRVAIYLAPVPQCTNTSSLTHRSFAELATLPPVTLPASDFASDGFFGHLRPEVVPVASHLFAQALTSRNDMVAALRPVRQAHAQNGPAGGQLAIRR